VVTIVAFAIMLTERLAGERITQMNRGLAGGSLAALAVFAGIAAVVLGAPLRLGPPGTGVPGMTTASLGRALLTDWALGLQVLGALLVVALLGAVYLARHEE
jgi:NADH:ubiquinone oxidoreductase subunit 6 (subunit J)